MADEKDMAKEVPEADILSEYKEELARLYRNNVRRKAALRTRHADAKLLTDCDRELREQIRELQDRLGIHY